MTTVKQKNPNSQINTLQGLIVSGVSSALWKSIRAPLELIKLRLQCMNEMVKQGTLDTKYNGVINCANRVISEEGFTALWKGNFANVLKFIPSKALSFGMNDFYKKMFLPRNQNDGLFMFFCNSIVLGAASGATSIIFTYSLDYCHTRLANDVKSARNNGEKQFKGIIDVYRKTYASDGIYGLHRGMFVSFWGIITYRGIYFGLNDCLNALLRTNSLIIKFATGYAVSLLAGIFSYPFDTIRRRMMMTSCEDIKYKGSFDCARSIIKTEGVSYLFRGISINLFSSIGSALAMMLYDSYKHK